VTRPRVRLRPRRTGSQAIGGRAVGSLPGGRRCRRAWTPAGWRCSAV